MAGTLAELLVKIGIDADDLEGGTEAAADKVEGSMGKVGVAAGVGSAALEGVARSSGDAGVTIGNLAGQLGMGEDAVADLATGMTDATFPMEDVTSLMQTAGQMGLETAEDIENFATTWDMVGDATGESGPELGKASVALNALGISAHEPEEALDALGFMMNETTQSSEEFLKFVERTGPKLSDMGMDIDDTAALLGLMESELGLSGRTARQEFRSAVSDSDGTMEGLLDTLGLSEQQFADMRGEVEGSGQAIEDNADRVEDATTPIQEMTAMWDDLMVKVAPFSGAIATAAFALAGVATAMAVAKGAVVAYNVVMGIYTGVQWAANTALYGFPLIWIIAAIIAVIAIIVLIIVYWDEIAAATAAAWEWIKKAFSAALSWIGSQLSSAMDWITGLWDQAWGWITRLLERARLRMIQIAVRLALGILRRIQQLRELPGRVRQFFSDMASRAQQQIQRMMSFVQSIPGRVRGFFSNAGSWLLQAGRNIIQGLIRGVTNMIGSLRDRFSSVTNMIPDWKGPESVDLKLLEGPGEDIMTGLSAGIEGGADGVRSTLQGITDRIPSDVSASVSHRGLRGGEEQRVVLDVTGADDDLVRVVQKWVRTRGRGSVDSLAGR